MFTRSKTPLYTVSKGNTNTSNGFIQAARQKTSETKSGNGARKYDSTGDVFVDDFASLSNYRRERSYQEVDQTMRKLWAEDKVNCVKLALYIRMVTRKTQIADVSLDLINHKAYQSTKTKQVQVGQGLKHEGIMRFLWLAINQEKVFFENIHLFIAAGSWKDIFTMLELDCHQGWNNRRLNWSTMMGVIFVGLSNENTRELVLKYIPVQRANSKTKTSRSQARNMVAKFIAQQLIAQKDSKLAGYRYLRKLKASGNAHQWQKLISKGLMKQIDFNTIAGKALLQLVGSKFLKNQNLEGKFEEFLMSKPVVKFTGYPHELTSKITTSLSKIQTITINKQFEGILARDREAFDQRDHKLIVVRDTSSSMNANIPGQEISAGDVAKSLAIYFSNLLKGPFHKHWIEFHDGAKMQRFHGDTLIDQWLADTSSYIGGTNFEAVGGLFYKVKKEFNLQEEEFPTGILCVSDGEFNRTGNHRNESNYDTFKMYLKRAGFSKHYIDNFKFIFWDIPNGFYSSPKNRKTKFETFGKVNNVFYMAGFDGAALDFILKEEIDDVVQMTQSEYQEHLKRERKKKA